MASQTWDHYSAWLKKRTNEISSDKLPVAPAIADLVTDSRRLNTDQWFFPLEGEKFDAHDFIAQVMSEKKARGFFYSRQKEAKVPEKWRHLGVRVDDTLKALQDIGNGWRLAQKNLRVFAITGSVGKTTCREMLTRIARQADATHTAVGNLNNEIGVPLTLLGLAEAHRYAVLELGARHVGDIAELTDIVAPDIVACLNATNAHLEIFGTRENLMATKLEIISHSRDGAKAVVSADDPLLLSKAHNLGRPLMTFGYAADADVSLRTIEWTKGGGLQLELGLKDFTEALKVQLPVAHTAYPINVAAATALAIAGGLKPTHVREAFAQFRGLKGRYRLIENDGLTVIDDTYNASPASMQAGLESLCRSFASADKVLLLGDMLELGTESEYAHSKLGELCYSLVKPKLLVTVGRHAESIASGAKAAGLAATLIKHFPSVEAFLAAKVDLRHWGEVVYAKASRGIGLDRFIATIEQP